MWYDGDVGCCVGVYDGCYSAYVVWCGDKVVSIVTVVVWSA